MPDLANTAAMMVPRAAIFLYMFTMLVGLVAQLRWMRFGHLHHVLYFFTFAMAIATAWLRWHPALLLTLGALAFMPLTKPRSPWHPALAVIGAVGYVAVFGFWNTP